MVTDGGSETRGDVDEEWIAAGRAKRHARSLHKSIEGKEGMPWKTRFVRIHPGCEGISRKARQLGRGLRRTEGMSARNVKRGSRWGGGAIVDPGQDQDRAARPKHSPTLLSVTALKSKTARLKLD